MTQGHALSALEPRRGAAHARRRRLGCIARRFASAHEGAAALEFALTVLPFLMLIFAVLELALLFLGAASLDHSMDKAARRIRTGEFQQQWAGASAEVQEAEFEKLVCGQVSWLIGDCRERLDVDVRTFGKHAWIDTTDAPDPYDPVNDVFDAEATRFTPGAATDIVLVRAWYRWPLFAPFVSQAVARLDGATALLTSAETFRTEPYA